MCKRVQYASSLFVDMFEKVVGAHLVRPVAPTLVLNGNIGKLTSFQTHAFLRHCSRIWKDVIYIPGPYELGSKIEQIDIPNVHFLNNRTVKLYDMYFMGSSYTSLSDNKWILSEFSELREKDDKIVATTFGIPSCTMLHSKDLVKGEDVLVGDLYPCVNAWICGYTRGAKNVVFDNNVLAVYNARGPLCGKNDFDGSRGWVRDAFIDIPNNPKIV